eukprot:Sspe_Gene.39339::Locus_18978_Transcript_2_3_Confidence_0.400_Length_1452::g.39339::m.39339/K14347/SLC10A7, P7; solute carrier family 10 (sodium/bile acid cotransporter), member 7
MGTDGLPVPGELATPEETPKKGAEGEHSAKDEVEEVAVDTEAEAKDEQAEPSKPTMCERAYNLFLAHHLLLFLALAFIIGLSAPTPGQKVSDPQFTLADGDLRVVQSVNVILIFLISGLRLNTKEVKAAIKAPTALITALVLILILTPCVGFLPANIPITPKEFKFGIALFCCVPTTLTSGAALVAQGAPKAAGLALMITVSTNLLGTLTTPFALKAVLSGTSASFDAVKLLVKLLVTILAPTLVGKALAEFVPPIARFSKDYKVPLTIFSNFNLVLIVWQSVSRSQPTIVDQSPGRIFMCAGFGILVHLIFWAICFPVWYLPIPHLHQRRAVFLLGSQKTLPVSMAIIAGLSEEAVGEKGLVALPCILGHLAQLVIDSFLVNRWVSGLKDEPDSEVDTKEPAADDSNEGEKELDSNHADKDGEHTTEPFP